jgi:hypothetical protein
MYIFALFEFPREFYKLHSKLIIQNMRQVRWLVYFKSVNQDWSMHNKQIVVIDSLLYMSGIATK